MSCGCDTTGGPYYNGVCREDLPYPQVSHESVPSLIDNLVTALYGSFYNPTTQTGYITKSVVNGRIVWNIPCDPNNTASTPGIPRNSGEGLLCYMIRCFTQFQTLYPQLVTLTGIQTLTNKTLTSPVITTPTGILASDIGVGILQSGITIAGSQITGVIPNSATTATNLNTASTIVLRDVSGNFSAGTITANLIGNVTGSVSGNAGTATNIAGGGAGQVPYNTGAGATAFLAAGTATQAIVGGTSPAWSTASSSVKLVNSAKAWYRGTISGGTLTQAAAFGCSVSRTGTGAFTVTLSNNSDANYVVVFSFTNATSLTSYNYTISNSTTFTFTTYVMSVTGSTLNQTATDLTSINFVVYGN